MPVVSMDFLTHRSHRMDFDSVLTRISLCAPTAQITSGGGGGGGGGPTHCSCRRPRLPLSRLSWKWRTVFRR